MSLKDIGVKPILFPQPTYMIGTYNDDDSVDVMMMAWGGVCARDMVALNIGTRHKTSENIRKRGAFTLAVPGTDTLAESDYFGIASGNDVADKFAKTGLHAEKSSHVNAPVITEYPLTFECEVVEIQEQPYGQRVLGKVVNIVADDSVLTADGKVDAEKLGAFAFDGDQNGYYAIGERVGTAWGDGKKYMK
ncbi:MAG: flavin reductase family protein [Pseudoramibacter sp.]|jgi:flavin reductase (DIM6/NTAB) family NADH-FMN oxidoreductase RutF